MSDKRRIELRRGTACAVHDLSATDAATRLREGIPRPGGIDACQPCLARVREYLKSKRGGGGVVSHQGGGPRNYVHKDFHNQIVEDLQSRVKLLEKIQEHLDDPDPNNEKDWPGTWIRRAVLAEARVAKLDQHEDPTND